MKPKLPKLLAATVLTACLTSIPVSAVDYYWDNNGATAGFGTASGTWTEPTTGDATQGFSTDATGATLPTDVTTTGSDIALFGTDVNGLGAGTVNVSGSVSAQRVDFRAASGAVTLAGGTINLTTDVVSRADGMTIDSDITISGEARFIKAKNVNMATTLGGVISGNGDVTFTSTNTNLQNRDFSYVLNGNSTYTGNTLIDGQNANSRMRIVLGVDNALPTTTVVTIDGGNGAGSGRNQLLQLNSKNQTIAGLTNVDRNLRTQEVQGPGTLTINNTSDHTFSGNLTGALNLVKSGSGTQTLSGANTYNGTTTITEGRLQGVAGSSIASSAVTLEALGTYGVSITDNSLSWTCASLTTSGAGTLEFDFGSVLPSASVSPMIISGAADFSAATPLVSVLVDAGLPVGTYPLATWGSLNGSAPTGAELTLSNVAPYTAADLSVTGNTLNLVISSTAVDVTKANNTVNLSDGSSWSGGTAPEAGDTAVWDNTVGVANTTVSLGADISWGAIRIEDPDGPVTINAGNTLTLTGDSFGNLNLIDMNSATTDLTVNADLVMTDIGYWDIGADRTLTVGGAISGDFGPIKFGDGTAVISGANSYTGATSVTVGTLQLGADDVIPNGSGNGNVVVQGTLDLNGSTDTINGLNGSGTIDNTADSTNSTLTAGDFGQSGTFSGILQNSGSSATLNFEKTGTGTIVLEGANTLTGSVTVSGGKLTFTNTNPFDNASGIVLDDGTTLESKVDGGNLTAPIDLSGGIGIITFPAFGSTGGQVYTLNLNSEISGAGGLTLFSTQGFNTKGTIVLGAANTYAGDTLINGDIFSESIPVNNSNLFVELGVENAFPTTTVLTIDGRNGDGSGRTAQVDLNGFNQTLAGLTNIPRTGRSQRVVNTSATAVTLTVDHATDYTFSGDIGVGSDTNFGLTKDGAGTFTLSGTNAYTGTTTIGGGMLLLEGSAVLTSGNLTLAGGVLGLTDDFTRALGTADNEVQWTGSGGFAAIGADRTVTLPGGSVQWNSGSFVPGAQDLILGNPDANRTIIFANDINFAGGNRTIRVDDGSDAIDASISGTLGIIGGTGGDFTKAGAGTLELANGNLYTGSTTVSDGRLMISHLSALASTSDITLAGGTTLLPSLDGVTVSAPITLGATGTTATIDLAVSGATTLTLDGAIGGDGNLLLDRSVGDVTSGTIVLGGQSTYLGTTEFDTAGGLDSGSQLTVQLGVADALPATTVLTMDGGTGAGSGRTLEFDLNGFDQTLAGLQNVSRVARNQKVTNSGALATLTVNNTADYDFGGSNTHNFGGLKTTRARIEGNISLVKSDVGIFTLVEAHTYTGDTTVNAGILSLGGINPSNESSTVTIADTGATLDLTFTGSDTVDKLFIGATQMAAGTYGPTATDIPQIINSSGTGTLTVTSGPGSAFDTWAGTGTLGAVTFDGDTNGDGVKDGLAFLLGVANPDDDATGNLPTVTESGGGLIISFNCLPVADRGTATLRVEHSSDLGVLDPWTATVDEVPDADDAVADNDVTFVVDTVSEAPLNKITATIDSAAAAGGKLFGRLQGNQP